MKIAKYYSNTCSMERENLMYSNFSFVYVVSESTRNSLRDCKFLIFLGDYP